MRQTRWFRTIATVLAVWFPLIVGEPGVVHACPAHGGAAATSVAATAHHHGMSHGSQPGHDHHDCTCISCCVGSVVAAPAPVAPTTVFVDAMIGCKKLLMKLMLPASLVKMPPAQAGISIFTSIAVPVHISAAKKPR